MSLVYISIKKMKYTIIRCEVCVCMCVMTFNRINILVATVDTHKTKPKKPNVSHAATDVHVYPQFIIIIVIVFVFIDGNISYEKTAATAVETTETSDGMMTETNDN